MFSLIVVYGKIFETINFNKLPLLMNILISLNKIKLNYLILIIILALFYYIKPYVYCILYKLSILYFFNIKFIYFLNFFFFGLFKIHPIMFYISLVLYWTYCTNSYLFCKLKLIYLIIISIVSLILGGIWALYQINWGYYWSNDPIEFSLLLIILLYVYMLHTLTNITKHKHLNYLNIILYIYLIRSNLIYTKHNFFNIYNYFYLYIKTLSYVCIINLNKYWQSCLWNYKYSKFTIILFITIIPLTFNLTFNIFIKKFIIIYSIYIILFSCLFFIWDDSKYVTIHIFLYISLFLFNLFKLQYFIHFILYQNYIKYYAHVYFKNYTKFEQLYFNKIKYNNILLINKNEYLYNYKKINKFYLKKKLINYFI